MKNKRKMCKTAAVECHQGVLKKKKSFCYCCSGNNNLWTIKSHSCKLLSYGTTNTALCWSTWNILLVSNSRWKERLPPLSIHSVWNSQLLVHLVPVRFFPQSPLFGFYHSIFSGSMLSRSISGEATQHMQSFCVNREILSATRWKKTTKKTAFNKHRCYVLHRQAHSSPVLILHKQGRMVFVFLQSNKMLGSVGLCTSKTLWTLKL